MKGEPDCLGECRRTGLYTASECREICRPAQARPHRVECTHSDEECPFLEEHG